MFSKSKIIVALFASTASIAFAGTMGGVQSNTELLIEVGGSYSHIYFKNNVVTPESRTVTTPAGVPYNPSNYFPEDFGGGYLGLSLYRNSWLMNLRYDMFALSGKTNYTAGTFAHIAPEKMSFTLDKTWQSSMPFIYGIGAGAAIMTYNEGQIFLTTPLGDNTLGRSFVRTRMAPLVEAMAMYKVADNINLRFNLAYHIPVTEVHHNGTLNANLGINYAVPL